MPWLIALLPAYLFRFKLGPVPTTALEILFWITFLAWFVAKFQKKEFSSAYLKDRLRYPFAPALMLFIVSSFIGLAVSGFNSAALGIYKAYFIEAGLFFVLAFNYFKDTGNRERVYQALAASAFAVSAYAVLQKFTGFGIANPLWQAEATRRVTSFFPYPNAVGLYLAPIVILLASKIISNFKFQISNQTQNLKFKSQNIFYFLVFLLSCLAIFFAKSEGAIVGLIAAFIVMGLLYGRKSLIVTSIVLIVGGGIAFSVPKLRDFAIEKATLRDFSGEVRKQQWRETWQAFTGGKLISGCGLANYQACVKPYHQEGIFFNYDHDPRFRNELVWGPPEYKARHWFPVEIYLYPHNIFLNFWSELSIIGLIAVLILITQYFYFGFKILIGNFQPKTGSPRAEKLEIGNSAVSIENNRILVLGLLAAIIQILVHGAVDVPYFKNDLSFLWWLIFAMMAVFWAESKKE